MTCAFTVQDCLGQTVILEHPNWQRHLRRHPEMAAHHGLVSRTLEQPDLVIKDPRAVDAVHFYRRDRALGRTTRRWLRVAVSYAGSSGHGVVTTAHFVRAILPKGQTLWSRRRQS